MIGRTTDESSPAWPQPVRAVALPEFCVVEHDEQHVRRTHQASAEAWREMPDEYACGFDALARPLHMTGSP
jgi:hypothetical protein